MAYYSGSLFVYKDIILPNIVSLVVLPAPSTEPEGKEYFIINHGNSNFVAIWADTVAGLNSGQMQIVTSDGLFVIDLDRKEVKDQYTINVKGKANELLAQEDIVDLTVN